MKYIDSIQFHSGSREELLPDYSTEFPYLASHVTLGSSTRDFTPWHWHPAVELFYMERGALDYFTPQTEYRFVTGSAGFINSNVLHRTSVPDGGSSIQLLHLFDPSFLAGAHGSLTEKKYILPLTTAPALDLFALSADDPAQRRLIEQIRNTFRIPEHAPGYEMLLRNALSEIWFSLFEQTERLRSQSSSSGKTNDKLKLLIAYIYEHYPEKISISALAQAAYLSERECFRVFQEHLHTTPFEYLKNCRLQSACRMLTQTDESVSAIGYACGLGSSSYFGKTFRDFYGCTPSQYREKWQDSDRK